MPEGTLPTAEQLGLMQDLSAATLYRSEVRRIPLLNRDEQLPYIAAAREGDTDAWHQLVVNCLQWTLWRAKEVYRDQRPEHNDLMDLVGHANVSMLEALPYALRAADPTAYLMTISASAMRRYVAYKDPLIERPKDKPLRTEHPRTVSIEGKAALSGPDTEPAAKDNPAVLEAVRKLSRRQRLVITLSYGLEGNPAMKNEDIALMLHVPKGTVEKYLWRAKKNLAKRLESQARIEGKNTDPSASWKLPG